MKKAASTKITKRLHDCDGTEYDAEKEEREKIQERLTYNKVYKDSNMPAIIDKYRDDPKMQYFIQCVYADQELFLPVLEYVHAKTLCLYDYTLSIGHCNALAKAFGYFDDFVNRVIFDNCGIDDQEMAAIIRGCLKMRDFKKIIYRQNIFAEEALE